MKKDSGLLAIAIFLAAILAWQFINHKFIGTHRVSPFQTPVDVVEGPESKILTGKKIDINSASIDELRVLPGIGESLAKRIVEARSTMGGFKGPGEIRKVPGIGEAKYKKIRHFIDVE